MEKPGKTVENTKNACGNSVEVVGKRRGNDKNYNFIDRNSGNP
ncbi:hypothetical protein [Roseofilum casamattae]|uniref:Uncharacterized protein n=1 Tax=Roseofilum casamattae BLCC-M143 TaxID=3022442 RepID=A0ABT7C1E3_9CYAN|nr:hypothetical protein [Roseofilum casamattae]MDJ1184328.1 hypothetical protein [Roseofilum casamattae BLCC-M143]